MVWCVFRHGANDKLQSHVLVCSQVSDGCAQRGMTTSGYGGEDTLKIRGVGYSPVRNEVIPSYAENASLAYHMEYLLSLLSSFNSVEVSAP